MDTIPIVVEEAAGESTRGVLSGGVLNPKSKIEQMDADKLRRSLSNLSGQISGILQDIKNVGDFKLTTVQLSVEISAEGGVALIGSAKAGAKGAIQLTFGV